MAHATTQQAAAPHHDVAEETPEQAADRAASEAVERAISGEVGRPLGRLLAVGGAGISLAMLSTLAAGAPPYRWLWLLPSILTMAWGLALYKRD